MYKPKLVRIVGASAVAFLFLLRAAMPGAAAPIQEEENAADGSVSASREVTDMRGRTVTIPPRIDGIIALGANSLRLLTYFDAVDKVIAVEDTGHAREKTVHDFFYLATYRLAHPWLRELPSIGGSANHEAIIAAAPDIVFSSTVDVASLDQLQATLNIPVFAVDADVEINDPDRFVRQIRTVGNVLGEDARAEELIDVLEGTMADLARRTALVTEPTRAYAGGMMYYGPADLFRTTGDYAPFDLTNTVNVMPSNPAGNRQPYMTSIEEVIEADPEFVFIDAANIELSTGGYLGNRAVLDETVTAFRNRDVYTTLVYKYYGTNWTNQLINVYLVGSVLYPEVFADIAVGGKAEEIWEAFFGVSVDFDTVADTHGPGIGRVDWW